MTIKPGKDAGHDPCSDGHKIGHATFTRHSGDRLKDGRYLKAVWHPTIVI